MEIFKIHEMRWANTAQDAVLLVADTATGARERICTPYGADSIIWDAVRAYPRDQILSMLPPEPVADLVEDVVDVVPRPVE